MTLSPLILGKSLSLAQVTDLQGTARPESRIGGITEVMQGTNPCLGSFSGPIDLRLIRVLRTGKSHRSNHPRIRDS